MKFEYNQQIEEFSMFDFAEEIAETTLIGDEWNSYYEQDEYDDATMKLFPIDFSGVYAGMAADAIGEAYCTTDSCEIKLIKDNQ